MNEYACVCIRHKQQLYYIPSVCKLYIIYIYFLAVCSKLQLMSEEKNARAQKVLKENIL